MMYRRNKKQFKPVTGGMRVEARPAENKLKGMMQARPAPIGRLPISNLLPDRDRPIRRISSEGAGDMQVRPAAGKLKQIMDARPAQNKLQKVRNEARMEQLAQKLGPEAELRKRAIRLRRGA